MAKAWQWLRHRKASQPCWLANEFKVIMSKPLINNTIREASIPFKGMKPALITGVYSVLDLN
eukprot:1156751-Pelagomonas_calceolata.AAC.1